MITYQSYFSAETKKLGKRLAKRVLGHTFQKRAVLIGLVGELGSGKTTFIQGFFQGLGLRRNALSPTFILMRRFGFNNKKFENLFHIDAYRIKNSREIVRLGLKEIIKSPQNIVLIEWADKIKKILPSKIIWLEFKHGERENERIIKIKI